MVINFLLPSGETMAVTAEEDRSVMEVARLASVPGMIGECGGSLTCATCHVYVDEEWMDRIPGLDEEEADMLEVVHEPKANSRLGCRIIANETIDGLKLTMPDRQA